MTPEHIRRLLAEGKGLTIEFKECASELSELNNSVWQTICAFSNRYGGHLILGANDKGEVLGTNRNTAPQTKKNFVNMLNNPQKISLSLFLSLEEVEVGEKLLLYVYVPVSAQIQSCSGRIYDRNEDGDFYITKSADLIAKLAIRKSSMYTEREIFPYVTENELRLDLVEQAKRMAISRNAGHPWKYLSPMELFRATRLYEDDWRSGKKGFNLAAILLFGRDDVISSCAPGYMTDALLRRDNVDRYDDRLTVGTNLIEAYDKLFDFISRHTKQIFSRRQPANERPLVDSPRACEQSACPQGVFKGISVSYHYREGQYLHRELEPP